MHGTDYNVNRRHTCIITSTASNNEQAVWTSEQTTRSGKMRNCGMRNRVMVIVYGWGYRWSQELDFISQYSIAQFFHNFTHSTLRRCRMAMTLGLGLDP